MNTNSLTLFNGVVCIALGLSSLAIASTAAAAGKPGREVNCELILPYPNPSNPGCLLPGTTIDDQIYELCKWTEESHFKNDSDRIGLQSKTIDMAVKIDQDKLEPDAQTKIYQYEDKLNSLESGDFGEDLGPGQKNKAKIDEYDKQNLLYELEDVKRCFDDILMYGGTPASEPTLFTEVIVTEPATTETTITEPATTETTTTEPATTEPATTEATTTTEPATTEPTTTTEAAAEEPSTTL